MAKNDTIQRISAISNKMSPVIHDPEKGGWINSAELRGVPGWPKSNNSIVKRLRDMEEAGVVETIVASVPGRCGRSTFFREVKRKKT